MQAKSKEEKDIEKLMIEYREIIIKMLPLLKRFNEIRQLLSEKTKNIEAKNE